jgi:hypothetical protein
VLGVVAGVVVLGVVSAGVWLQAAKANRQLRASAAAISFFMVSSPFFD